jgi:Zn-finger nucleic acid-binding protein
MITLELAEVEIDHCTTCGGIWLDAGEQELLMGHSEAARQVLESLQVANATAELPRKCPICDKKMKKILVGDSKARLLLDKCGRGHGLWFDKAELQDVLNRAKLDKDNKILTILTDMFGHAQPNKT